MRWKAHFFDINNTENSNSPNFNFRFKSDITPSQKEHLNAFENDLYEMVRCIEFRLLRNAFQKQLATDIKQINETDFALVSADKTTNMYEMSAQYYNKLLTGNITKTYKKGSKSDICKINLEAKSIAKQLNLDSKIGQFANKKSYVTLKDHKDNFLNSPKCRLINPAKSEISIVSKHYLEKINDNIGRKSELQQWRNTSSVIAWFTQIPSPKK